MATWEAGQLKSKVILTQEDSTPKAELLKAGLLGCYK